MSLGGSLGYWWAFVVGIALFGAIFAAAGLFMERRSANLRDEGTRVQVEVVKLHERRGTDRVTYAPEFRILSGAFKDRRWVSEITTNPPVHRVGERSAGYFDPNSGRIASASSNRNAILFSMIFSSVGLGLVAAGFIFWFRARGL